MHGVQLTYGGDDACRLEQIALATATTIATSIATIEFLK
jgi:hypothetical protein